MAFSEPTVTRLSQVKKLVVSVAGQAAVLGGLVAVADVTTVQGLVALGVAILANYGVYKVKNEPLTYQGV